MELEHVKVAWDEWEIYLLVLLSLSLQVFLFFAADLRRRSASRMLRNALWLAYLSADMVAVFVLGHLAVHAQGPSHELMLFWAPFVLIHLGGQDTITAFSKQDNELWPRHLLGLVTQTIVAGYVVSKSPWPDTRLRAAMVLMFLCGFLKYAGRTYCLYSASPKSLRASSMSNLWAKLSHLQIAQQEYDGKTAAKERFEVMFHAEMCWEFIRKETFYVSREEVDDIMLVDAPADDLDVIRASRELPDMLKEKSMPGRCIAYQYVSLSLVRSYQWLYTKSPVSDIFLLFRYHECQRFGDLFWILLFLLLMLIYNLFHCISTVIALILFVSAQKEGHHSKADIFVSYILLVGAIVLDLLPTLTFILFFARKPFRPVQMDECFRMCLASCVQPMGWRTVKQWSEELAQYSMTRRYASVRGDHGCMSSIRKWIIKCKPLLGAWCVEFLDLIGTPVSDELKLFVLDKLLLLQSRRQEWDFANFRGQRALRKWMDSHRVPVEEPERSGYAALHKSLSSRFEFPTSVLIWHIATEICYFSEDNGHDIENDEMKMTVERKKRSRELSQYILYLVFKCDVLLTSNSRLLHYKAHEEIEKILSVQSATANLDEKKAVIEMFAAMKEEGQMHSTAQSIEEALYSPVLPRASAVAQELIGIDDEAARWDLISEVWLEMLFYIAPRCGPDFHYEHLSTGGEFISHVLLLMRSLGPFMPKSGA